MFGKTYSLAILAAALLFGGMTLYSFGFAAFIFKVMPAPAAGATLRLAFPWFYPFVLATAVLAAMNSMNACVFMTATAPE